MENKDSISSITSHFQNNIPYGETNIYYANQSKILIQLNQLGQFCGMEKYFNEKNELIKIKKSHLEWVKKNEFYFILMKDNIPTKYLLPSDLKFIINCEYIGENLAIHCKQYPMMTSIDGFPCHEESTKNVKPTQNFFGLSLVENGPEMDLEKEKIIANDLCKNSSSIHYWLQRISSVPIIRSAYTNVIYLYNTPGKK